MVAECGWWLIIMYYIEREVPGEMQFKWLVTFSISEWTLSQYNLPAD
jgi:hypothetical protein